MGSGQPLPIISNASGAMQGQTLTKFISRYAPLVAWIAFISYASSDGFSSANTSRIIEPLVLWLFPHTQPERLELIHFGVRKAAHFTEYAILGILAARAFRTSPSQRIGSRWFPFSLALIATYALIDEYHQSFVPSRSASILDSLLDMCGGVVALLIIRMRHRARTSAK